MSAHRRIIVSGMGLVTPLGCSLPSTWAGLLGGACGTRSFQAEGVDLPCKVAAPVDDSEFEGLAAADEVAKDAKRVSRFIRFASVAAHEAYTDASLQNVEDRSRIAVIIGSAMGDLHSTADTHGKILEGGTRWRRSNPHFVPMTLVNSAAARVAMRYSITGPVDSGPITACATGVSAIGYGLRLLRSGEADVVVCGSAEACIHPISLVGFSQLRALSTSFNAAPETASRPFDRQRDGFVMGEGSGIVVLESEEHAQKRGVTRAYGEVCGFGQSCDAHHVVQPKADGSGAAAAIRLALANAQVDASSIHHVNCHATSTPVGDAAEARALESVFGARLGDGSMSISALKGQLGHLQGAAGAVESVLALKSIFEETALATANFEEQEDGVPRVPLLAAPGAFPTAAGDAIYTVKTSFGFGGHNTAVVFRSP